MLHKILTAGPSAFNITTLLSQAAQLSSQAAQQSNQSPMSLTSDASSPRSYVSPRISTPQSNAGTHKPLLGTPPAISQPKVSTPSVKQASLPQPAQPSPPTNSTPTSPPPPPRAPSNAKEKNPNTFHLHPCTSSSQRSPSPGPNHVATSSSSNSHSHHSSSGGGSNSSNPSLAPNSASGSRPSSSFTPTLAAHFNESLIKHVQGWPADHAEKQASRLREEAHTMGSICMSENCTELKNLRSLVRVCEIQATLREQRLGLGAIGWVMGVACISHTRTRERRFLSSVQFSDMQMLPMVWASSRSRDALQRGKTGRSCVFGLRRAPWSGEYGEDDTKV
ncbi:hypothetical protein CRUP_017339 [Coryphaenoides rupestris]|nr:hypothetical protein CRUP_017339 [Coryphaenoides rupestris]